MPSSSSWTDAMVGHRVFCTFGDCPCGNAPFDAKECLDGAPPSTHLVSLGHRCFLQCCAAPKDVTTSRCTCNLVMRVAGRFTEDERAGFSCYSRVELAQQRGLEIGQVASATLNNDVLVTARGRQVPTYGALAEPPLSECLFDVDVAAVASRFVLDQCKSDNLFVFKSYLVLGGAIVGWAQSPPFTIAIKAPIAVKPPLSMSISAPILELIAICDCSSPHFSPDYFRMNKAFGRKELRCFPHCCPHHMPYNSCNVPLHVRLVFGNPRLCIIAARVELAKSTLKLGDSVAMDVFDHDSNWITGTTQDDENEVVYSFQASQQLGDRQVMMGWPYSWTSTASHISREQLHVWTAYAFEHQSTLNALRVVAVWTSPAFSVGSYRRRRITDS